MQQPDQQPVAQPIRESPDALRGVAARATPAQLETRDGKVTATPNLAYPPKGQFTTKRLHLIEAQRDLSGQILVKISESGSVNSIVGEARDPLERYREALRASPGGINAEVLRTNAALVEGVVAQERVDQGLADWMKNHFTVFQEQHSRLMGCYQSEDDRENELAILVPETMPDADDLADRIEETENDLQASGAVDDSVLQNLRGWRALLRSSSRTAAVVLRVLRNVAAFFFHAIGSMAVIAGGLGPYLTPAQIATVRIAFEKIASYCAVIFGF